MLVRSTATAALTSRRRLHLPRRPLDAVDDEHVA